MHPRCCSVAVIVLILINMIVALIVMVNMLIAQLSNSYENALNEAELQFDIDKYFMVSKLEQSHFRRGVCSCFVSRARASILFDSVLRTFGSAVSQRLH